MWYIIIVTVGKIETPSDGELVGISAYIYLSALIIFLLSHLPLDVFAPISASLYLTLPCHSTLILNTPSYGMFCKAFFAGICMCCIFRAGDILVSLDPHLTQLTPGQAAPGFCSGNLTWDPLQWVGWFLSVLFLVQQFFRAVFSSWNLSWITNWTLYTPSKLCLIHMCLDHA